MSGITDIPGLLAGHATDLDALTGCTVVLCPNGAVAGVATPGRATASLQLDVLSAMHSNERVHGICLTGGSAYGLESAFGVLRFLERKKIGFPAGAGVVPLVPAAALYDLGIGKAGVRPDREMGEKAAAAASADPIVEGAVGAGTGATVGKIFGMARAMKSGIGSATVRLEGPYAGVRVAALAAVNALGDIIDAESGRIIAGARVSKNGREFANTAQQVKRGATGGFKFENKNTTLVVVATNARLSKVDANKLAQFGALGMGRAINPVWTNSDGDTVFALSYGEEKADLMALGVAASEAVSQAIVRAVRLARSAGGVPGLAG
jgi:L-aminopeptidase/D-esterase-like protein